MCSSQASCLASLSSCRWLHKNGPSCLLKSRGTRGRSHFLWLEGAFVGKTDDLDALLHSLYFRAEDAHKAKAALLLIDMQKAEKCWVMRSASILITKQSHQNSPTIIEIPKNLKANKNKAMNTRGLCRVVEAFTTGSWALHFGGPKEVTDIQRASGEAAKVLEKMPGETPILCTKCYTDSWHKNI